MLIITRRIGQGFIIDDGRTITRVVLDEVLDRVVCLRRESLSGVSVAFPAIDQGIMINEAWVMVSSIVNRSKVRIGIQAPKRIKVLRCEKIKD